MITPSRDKRPERSQPTRQVYAQSGLRSGRSAESEPAEQPHRGTSNGYGFRDPVASRPSEYYKDPQQPHDPANQARAGPSSGVPREATPNGRPAIPLFPFGKSNQKSELPPPSRSAQTTQLSEGVRELVPPSTAPSLSSKMAFSPSVPTSSSTPSLAERLRMGPPTLSKRSRVDPPIPVDGGRPSLLSRLSVRDSPPDAKRPKEDVSSSQSTTPSLLSRMGRSNGTHASPAPSSAPLDVAQGPSAQPPSFRHPSVPSPIAPHGISILNRSGLSTSQPAIVQAISLPSPVNSQSIDKPLQTPSAISINIRNHSAISAPEIDDEPIVRKGRGFRRDDSPEDFIMAPSTPVPAPTLDRARLRRPEYTMRVSREGPVGQLRRR